jgi:Cdc6-like AAA superfamily ATPase
MQGRTVVLKGGQIRKAIGAIAPRSERAADLEHLVATFVDSGVIDLVDNIRNQIVYGRRGTGKTHLLRFLEARFSARESTLVTYIDARTLGSSAIFTDQERSLHERFLGVCKDIFAILHNALFEELAEKQVGNVDEALNALGELEKQLAYSESYEEEVRVRAQETALREGGMSTKADLSNRPGLGVEVRHGSSESSESEVES